MKGKLSKNEKLTIIFSIILILALFAGLYYFILVPKLEQITIKEMELDTQRQILATLENKMNESNSDTFESTVTLQQMVPVKPLAQQLILEIEKAEIVSGSFVASMSFSDSEAVTGETELKNSADIIDKLEGTNEEQPPSIHLPEGVMKLTVNLSVESADYFKFKEFIRILENSKRVIVIDSINFSGGEEITEEEQSADALRYQVTISAFYMPTLTDLMDRLPKMESPKPANKKNPLNDFTDVARSSSSSTDQNKEKESEFPSTAGNPLQHDQNENDEIEESSTEGIPEVVEVVTNEQADKVEKREERYIFYTVQPKDTVYRIAMSYYNSSDGIEKIEAANGLSNHHIEVGQVLKIPLK